MQELDYEGYYSAMQQQYSVILFDASWDIGPGEQIRHSFGPVLEEFSGKIFFGKVDVDAEQGIAKSIGLRQVPTVGYFSEGKLKKLVVGAHQDIQANIQEHLQCGI